MSAEIKKLVKIKVTGGDAVANNRVSGKSNTGTYFICSQKDFSEFQDFFKEPFEYYLDINKINIYLTMINIFLKPKKDDYIDKMENFDEYCYSLMTLKNNPLLKGGLRINDTRYFLRFTENDNMIVDRLRSILYADYSLITIENRQGCLYIYPEFNDECLEKVKYNLFK